MPDLVFHFQRNSRSPGSVLAVATALLFLAILALVFHTHPIIVAVLAVFIAPALWDILRNATASLTLSIHSLGWQIGDRAEQIPISEIDSVHIKTRFDLSQRATVTSVSGEKLYIPSPCMPRGRELDLELGQRGIATQRTIF